MDFSWHEARVARLSQLDNMSGLESQERDAEESYRMLHANRMRIGLSRLSIGFHLCRLKASEAWRGRTGSKSFHRFMIEEGLEPKAAVQYMAVAQAYLIDHDIEPKAIAGVSMRLLHSLIGRLRPTNVREIVDIVASLPAAEARAAVEDRFPLIERDSADGQTSDAGFSRSRLAPGAYRIFTELDAMSFDERRDLYRALHLKVSGEADMATQSPSEQGVVARALKSAGGTAAQASSSSSVHEALSAANDPLRHAASVAA